MDILFVMRHAGYLRNFESTLRLLAERGHRLHVAFDNGEVPYQRRLASESRNGGPGSGAIRPPHRLPLVERLAAEYPNFTHGLTPDRRADQWVMLGRKIRLGIDYLRYLEPSYRDAPKLRARIQRRAPAIVPRAAAWPVLRTGLGRRALGAGLRVLDRALPDDARVLSLLREHHPDILLVTPLVELGSPQIDYVRAAQRLGIRTGLCIASWDNLTNKGLIHEVPDLVAVWSEALKKEAVEMHGIPPANVAVTGAQAYDHWFDWAPSTTRAEFCARVGLRADRPYLLYLCSSPFISARETPFVLDWIRRLRASDDPSLRDVGVLIRPHPQNSAQWRDIDLAPLGPAAVWPRAGADPVDVDAKSEFYDTIYHSAAVVGVNTSALIESAIVGRAVHTLLAPEFRDTQEGTLHFHHLLRVNGGLLHVAESFEEHHQQLATALASAGQEDAQARRFLQGFIRPYGLEQAATPRVVAAIEEACRRPASQPRPRPALARPIQLALIPVADSMPGGRLGPGDVAYSLLRAVLRASLRQFPVRRFARRAVRASLRQRPVRRFVRRSVVPALRSLTDGLVAYVGEGKPKGAVPQQPARQEDENVAQPPLVSSVR
jgi:hypothetical protein